MSCHLNPSKIFCLLPGTHEQKILNDISFSKINLFNIHFISSIFKCTIRYGLLFIIINLFYYTDKWNFFPPSTIPTPHTIPWYPRHRLVQQSNSNRHECGLQPNLLSMYAYSQGKWRATLKFDRYSWVIFIYLQLVAIFVKTETKLSGNPEPCGSLISNKSYMCLSYMDVIVRCVHLPLAQRH